MRKQKTGIKLKKDNGDHLLKDLSHLIEKSQNQVAVVVNSAVTMLFWQVGKRMNDHILQNKRAEYGKEVVLTVSTQLKGAYGRNFEEKNLRRMMQFADVFPEIEIVVTLSRQLSWSHFLILIPLKNEESKLYYAKLAIEEKLGVRELRKLISNKTFERTALANLQISGSSIIPFNTFKDPYILDFLQLKDGYLEKDLETAILRELENFILETGKGFAFCRATEKDDYRWGRFSLRSSFFSSQVKKISSDRFKNWKISGKG